MPRPMHVAGALMFAAALLRLAATVHGLGNWAMVAAAALWTASFALYLVHFGTMLLQPSRRRGAGTS